MAKRLRRILWIPDVHVPYHDRRAWALMLKAMAWWKPDEIVVLGDFADFYSVSSHDKDPTRTRLLDEEVEEICGRRAELDALGAKKKRFIAGNHEDRLERYLMQKAPELINLVRVKDLFELTAHGWDYTPYKQDARVGKIYATHDTGGAGPTAHVKALNAFQHNTVIGHVHRMAVHYQGNALGETHVGACFGWLGDVDQVDYMHRIGATAWQLGFGLGHQEPNGVTHLTPVPIIKYRCIVDGKLFIG